MPAPPPKRSAPASAALPTPSPGSGPSSGTATGSLGAARSSPCPPESWSSPSPPDSRSAPSPPVSTSAPGPPVSSASPERRRGDQRVGAGAALEPLDARADVVALARLAVAGDAVGAQPQRRAPQRVARDVEPRAADQPVRAVGRGAHEEVRDGVLRAAGQRVGARAAGEVGLAGAGEQRVVARAARERHEAGRGGGVEPVGAVPAVGDRADRPAERAERERVVAVAERDVDRGRRG